ncbi:MAG: hypothetical protein H7249_08425 [Chitinophagaceae bacterium]|nr:hypothetical protein [Oligoflexus sp.]
MHAFSTRSLLATLSLIWSGSAFSICLLQETETIADLKGAFCSVNNVHVFGYGEASKTQDGKGATVIDTDTSVFVLPKLSFHFKAYVEAFVNKPHGQDVEKGVDRTTDQGYVHLGHSLEDPIQLSVGRLPLPFGLRQENLRWELPQRTDAFWDRSVNGAVVTWRARNDLTIDVGGTNKNSNTLADKEFSSFTVRATEHLDLLSGTKLIGSYQNQGGSTVGKMGLATIVFNNDDMSSLEWVRVAEDWKTTTYQQLFRFVYQNRDNDKLWNFEYEDLRHDTWRLAISVGKNVTPDWILGGALQYERQRFDKGSNWVGLFNVTYAVTAQTNLLRLL